MFAVNDYVVYSGNGVCKVDAICTPKLGGIDTSELYYVISTVGVRNNVKIYVQVDNPKVSIRKIMSKEQAEKIIDSMPSIETIWTADEKNREKSFTQAVNSCDCRDWIKIIKTMYQVNLKSDIQSKTRSRIGEVYVKAAREKLFGEFALSLGVPVEEVEGYIINRVKALESKPANPVKSEI